MEPNTHTVITHTTTTVTHHLGAGWALLGIAILIALIVIIVLLLKGRKPQTPTEKPKDWPVSEVRRPMPQANTPRPTPEETYSPRPRIFQPVNEHDYDVPPPPPRRPPYNNGPVYGGNNIVQPREGLGVGGTIASTAAGSMLGTLAADALMDRGHNDGRERMSRDDDDDDNYTSTPEQIADPFAGAGQDADPSFDANDSDPQSSDSDSPSDKSDGGWFDYSTTTDTTTTTTDTSSDDSSSTSDSGSSDSWDSGGGDSSSGGDGF